jgi:archaellum component FlaC
LQESQKKAQARLEAEGQNIATQKTMGVTLFDSILDLAKAGKIAGQDAEARKQQLEAQKNIQNALLNFEQAIQDVRNKIFKSLLDSKIFDKFADVMGKLSEKFTAFMNTKGIAMIEKQVDKFSKFLNTFIDDLGKLDFKQLVDKYIFAPIKKLLFGTAGTPDEKDQRGNVTKEGTEGTKGILSPIVDAFKNIGKYLVVGGVGLALVLGGIGLALTALAGPAAAASPGLLAIGAAFAGIGVAAGGISMLINAITNAVGNLADGAKKFEELDADQLKLVGGGLKELTGPIMDLAKGGIVANFVGSGAFENLANGIREFESVDPTKLHAVGPALTSLHKGMSAFTGDGVLDSISKALGSLFGGSSGSISDLAEDVKEFADVDAQGLKAIGEGLQGIANFIEKMDGANLRNVSKSLTELTKQLGEYQEQYSKMDSETKANLTSNFTAFGEGQKGAADKLDQLNNSVQMMLAELRKIASTSRDTADNLT